MIANPITVSPKTTYAEAFRLLHVKKVHALPVIDKEEQLVGIITERDLLDVSPVAVLGAHSISYLLSTLRIESAMTRQVITVQEDCALEAAARILIDYKIGSLPVMRGHQLVGIVKEIDILRMMMEAFGGRSEGLRITFRLLEDNGELGAITDGIIQLGGKLTHVSTYWGDDPFQRVVTLRVQAIHQEDLLLLLEGTIGVQVVECCESLSTHTSYPTSPTANPELSPIPQLDAKIPWPLEPK